MIKTTRLAVACAIVMALFASPSWADGRGHHRIVGAYSAKLDLNPLGVNRIEAMAIILHQNGTVNYISEHEPNDLESAGIGVWKRLSKKRIGVGILNFRMGVEGGCTFIGAFPPDNCVLKLGATLEQKARGHLVGELVLSFESVDAGPLVLPPLPFSMERLKIEDFPGALPLP